MALPRLLFLHTGGTLGMIQRAPGPLEPGFYDANLLPFVAGLDAIADIEGRVVCALDSSDLSPAIWVELATIIANSLDRFDGFVILHGTDTMAWTASALSYMLRGLDRPVILTGSQRPLAELRTDARSNVVHSAICATRPIPEVGLCFGDTLFRGNRATKVSIQDYGAFASPNAPPLLRMGVDIEVGPTLPPPTTPFSLAAAVSESVSVLTLFPGMSPVSLLRLAESSAVVVLRGFGEGNIPQARWPEAIAQVCAGGGAVVVTSQSARGRVLPGRYQCSQRARDAGAFFASDMTLEATVTKIMWLLGQGVAPADLGGPLLRPLAGELSP
jgi:L-asparaginase